VVGTRTAARHHRRDHAVARNARRQSRHHGCRRGWCPGPGRTRGVGADHDRRGGAACAPSTEMRYRRRCVRRVMDLLCRLQADVSASPYERRRHSQGDDGARRASSPGARRRRVVGNPGNGERRAWTADAREPTIAAGTKRAGPEMRVGKRWSSGSPRCDCRTKAPGTEARPRARDARPAGRRSAGYELALPAYRGSPCRRSANEAIYSAVTVRGFRKKGCPRLLGGVGVFREYTRSPRSCRDLVNESRRLVSPHAGAMWSCARTRVTRRDRSGSPRQFTRRTRRNSSGKREGRRD